MTDEKDKEDGNEPGFIAALRRFYRERPITFDLALIAVSTLCLITGIWMLPAQPG